MGEFPSAQENIFSVIHFSVILLPERPVLSGQNQPSLRDWGQFWASLVTQR